MENIPVRRGTEGALGFGVGQIENFNSVQRVVPTDSYYFLAYSFSILMGITYVSYIEAKSPAR